MWTRLKLGRTRASRAHNRSEPGPPHNAGGIKWLIVTLSTIYREPKKREKKLKARATLPDPLAQLSTSCLAAKMPRPTSAYLVANLRGKSTSERPIKLHKYPSSEHKLSSIGAASVLHNLKCKHWFLMLRRIMDMFGSL